MHPRWERIADRLHVIAVDADASAPIATPKARKFDVLRTSLWSDERDATLNITRNPGCSSLFVPNTEFLRRFPDSSRFDVLERRTIHTKPLSTIDRQPHFIKLDVQGAELAILEGAGSMLDSVIGIEVEVEFAPMYEKQPLFSDVHRFMQSRQFELCDLNRFFWRDQTNQQMRCVFADALYFKRPDCIQDAEIARAIADCYALTLRQAASHAFQWISRYLRPRRFYDADQQLSI